MSIELHGIVQSNSCGDGNRMFQLFTAIIYAHKNNLFLMIKKDVNTIINVNYDKLNANKVRKDNLVKIHLGSSHFDQQNELKFFGHDKLYFITDFFQNAIYLNNNYDIIMQYVTLKQIIKPPLYNNISHDDILCTLRIDDNRPPSELVSPSYFLSIFERHNYRNIYFMIYAPHNNDYIETYLSHFHKYKDNIKLIHNNNSVVDFYCVNYFKHIAITTSTFNWWSIFFCNNIQDKTIYTPRFFGSFSKNGSKGPIYHRGHCKDLFNIRNFTIPIQHTFFQL